MEYLFLIGLISLIIYKTLIICQKKKINEYSSLTEKLACGNRILNYTFNNIINIFLIISFFVMVAGFGSFFKQEFGIQNILGAITVTLFTLLVLKNGAKGIEKINCIIVPFIIISICFLKYKVGMVEIRNIAVTSEKTWVLKSFLYASYNSIILIPTIINFSSKINSKKQILRVCIGTFLITLIMSLAIYLLIQKNFEEVINIQMPIIFLAGRLGNGYKIIYSMVILTAIFTTAISSGYSFLINITKNKKQYIKTAWLISIIAILLSPIGFGKLLNLLYPILGYLGLTQIIFVIFKK